MDARFILDLCKAYGKKAAPILQTLWAKPEPVWEISIGQYKATSTPQLESGIKGDPEKTRRMLIGLNHLLDISPQTAAFFMSGSDFLDALISCYKLMNPPLRKAIIATAYLCLIGLTKGDTPNYSLLIDTLYALKDAAETHKSGPLNERESLVPELISITPILSQLRDRIAANGTFEGRAKPILASLEAFKKPVSGRPKRLIKREIDKGKGMAPAVQTAPTEMHIHRMSLVSQIQDLFPDLGDGFILRLLDEYNDNVEEIISHLLEDNLPPRLASLDRGAKLPPTPAEATGHDLAPDLNPRPTPKTSPTLPARRNIYDDDEFDQLAINTSNLHFGRKDAKKTADDVLKDRQQAPDRARIMAALAAFDSDDDERDDTYDTADIGGTVEVSGPDGINLGDPRNNSNFGQAESAQDARDEMLFKVWKQSAEVFGRDTATRRSQPREVLKRETGMTDEALEGWALMLTRDPRRMRKLEARFSGFSGQQQDIGSSRWQADSGTEGSDGRDFRNDRGRGGKLHGQSRGRGRGGGDRGGRGGSVAGPTGERGTEVARERKTENKGRGANHNRRDARAKKVARAGFGV